MSNLFEITGFYICESVYSDKCDGAGISRIAFKNNSIQNILIYTDPSISKCTFTGPFNLTEVEKYILNESSKL